MVKLKNHIVLLKHFVLFLTFSLVFSCAEKKYSVSKTEGKAIEINNNFPESPVIDSFIKPYRQKIDNDLSAVLAFAPNTIDKTGEWQTPMGNFLSDIIFEKSNALFRIREKKSIDICLLNHGGIRSIIPKGDVTAKTAYEIMPFENSAVVIALKSEQILELINYFIATQKPHPLKGLTFTIDSAHLPKNISINGNPLETDRIYYVVTHDYLANGNDNMHFFKKGIIKYDLDYKIRNIIIDYFKENKTITANNDIRISKE